MRSVWLFLVALGSLHALPWSPTPPAPITVAFNSSFEVVSAPTPNGNQFIATFLENTGKQAQYCLYDTVGQTWSAPAALPIDVCGGGTYTCAPVYCAYGGGVNLITATKSDVSGSSVIYTVYDGLGFSAEAAVPTSTNVLPGGAVYAAYNSVEAKFVVTWVSSGSPEPVYAVYDPTGDTWTTPTALSAPLNDSIKYVYSVSNPTDGKVLIVWASSSNDLLNSNPGAYYSFGTLPNSFSATALIPAAAPSSVSLQAFPTYDLNSNKYLVTWTDMNGGRRPSYTIFDGISSWTPLRPIPGSDQAALKAGVTGSWDSVTGTLLFTWTNFHPPFYPTYVTYNSTLVNPWSVPAPIPPGNTSGSINFPFYSSFDPSSSAFMLTWQAPNPIYDTLLLHPSTVTVTTTPNPSTVFQTVTIVAQITGAGPTPTGTTIFYINGAKIGPVPVIDGIASFITDINCGGDSVIQVDYLGDSYYFASSGSAVHTVECLTQ